MPPNGNGAPSKSPMPASSPAPGMFHRAHMAFAGAALCLLVAVSYFPALSAGFVWDDELILPKAAPLHTWSGLAQIWFTPRALMQYEGHYWPLLYTTFWLEHKLWGLAPLGYHLVNLLLHAGVVWLLWRLLRRLGVPGAWFAAAVFAVHPLHVESVVWVIGRKDILATLCYLASVLAYIRFAEMRRGERREGYYLLAGALFVLGLLSKSHHRHAAGGAVALALVAARACDHGRWHPHAAVLPGGLGIALADYAYYTSLEHISFAYSLLERGLIAARALAFTPANCCGPAGLTGVYPRWEPGLGDMLAWVARPALRRWWRCYGAGAGRWVAGRWSACCSLRWRCRRCWASWTSVICSSRLLPTVFNTSPASA